MPAQYINTDRLSNLHFSNYINLFQGSYRNSNGSYITCADHFSSLTAPRSSVANLKGAASVCLPDLTGIKSGDRLGNGLA